MSTSIPARVHRTHPIGTETTTGGTHFRVWAPGHRRIDVVFSSPESVTIPLERESSGHFSAFVPAPLGSHGSLYKLSIDGGTPFPDPASRFQPDGPHGPSQLWNSSTFDWSAEASWPGVSLEGQILYELHIGTFTPEGTYAAAAKLLPYLKETGITVIELMPVNEFPGNFGWGYDGVDLFAPYHLYGSPDDLRSFILAAHLLGIGVILDVVYNHLGPDGNYLTQFSKSYFTNAHKTAWGDAINFDEAGSDGVREFFIANARYWISEFHFDGLRLDATQAIIDTSPTHILAEISSAARSAARNSLKTTRSIILIAENEINDTSLLHSPSDPGAGIDAIWNDDMHHSTRVALTGRSPAYFVDHAGSMQELLSAAKYGFLFHGQRHGREKNARGGPTNSFAPWQFLNFIENHDQVSSSLTGSRLRLLTSPAKYRVASAYLMLGPGTPMLFQGQEYGSTHPFPYFVDHGDSNLAEAVRKGRGEFLAKFIAGADPNKPVEANYPDPSSAETFANARLDWAELDRFPEIRALYRDLIALRRTDPVFAHTRTACDPAPDGTTGFIDGALISANSFILRYALYPKTNPSESTPTLERLLVFNFGSDLHRTHLAEPLIAPPPGHEWTLLWSSEEPIYGGSGTPHLIDETGWHLGAESAAAYAATPIA